MDMFESPEIFDELNTKMKKLEIIVLKMEEFEKKFMVTFEEFLKNVLRSQNGISIINECYQIYK
jgi:hypothetical protein